MGKSATAEKFRTLRVPVFDSDASVHDLMALDGNAFAPIAMAFPRVVTANGINRQKLGAAVFDNDDALEVLEDIIHPLVRAKQRDFVKQYALTGAKFVVLDIPLLYETGAENRCDVVIVVSAPALLQARRVLSRPGMTMEKFNAIKARQTPDYIKRRRADFVVSTGMNHRHARAQIQQILISLSQSRGLIWPTGQSGARRFDLVGQLYQ